MVSDRIDAAVWRLSAVVLLGATMSILDTTIVNMALATLGRELHSTVTGIQRVVTGYPLALAAVIPVTGFINVALWQSPEAFQAATTHPEFTSASIPFPFHASLYEVIHEETR